MSELIDGHDRVEATSQFLQTTTKGISRTREEEEEEEEEEDEEEEEEEDDDDDDNERTNE